MPKKINKLKIAILGGDGLLGSDLASFFNEHYDVTAITRTNYSHFADKIFNVFINANGNSRRFWANENPREDFEQSTNSVMDSLVRFQFEKYVYISSSDVYANPSSPATTDENNVEEILKLSPYGFHKRISEELVRYYAKDFLIIRLAALLGTRLKKGLVFDLWEQKELFVSPHSWLQFITTVAVGDIIQTLLEKNIGQEIINVGGQGSLSPAKAADLMNRPVHFRTDAKPQCYEMDIKKIQSFYPALKTSEKYLSDFIKTECLR